MTFKDVILDCYYSNTIPSFQKARDSGLRGVIHKCSEGTTFADPLYAKRKTEIASLGMLFGAYHFGRKGNAIAQADFFLSLVGDDPNTLLCLDLERDLQGNVMPITDAEVFVQRVKDKTGKLPVVYTGKWVLDIINPTGHTSPLFDCPLWVASYTSEPTLPTGWKAWKLWQYTNGRVGSLPHTLPGLGANDLSVYNGTLDEMKAFFQGNSPIGPGIPAEIPAMEVRMKYVNTNSLNVRKGPGLRYPIAYSLPRDTPVTVRVPGSNTGDGWTWVERNLYPGLWLANEWLRDPTPGSKIGVHLSQFNYDPTAFLAMLGRMYKAGKPMCLVKILGPGEQITPAQVKAVSPSTTVIYRYVRLSDGGYDMPASEIFRQFIDPYKALWSADYFQIRCEWNAWDKATIQQRTDELRWAEVNSGNYRKRLLDPGWATGNPGGDPMDTYGQQYIQDYMRYIRDHGHIFSLDEYYRNDYDFELFRFLHRVYPNLPADLRNNMPPVIFAEFSVDGIAYFSYDALLSQFKIWNAELVKYPFVKGAAIFALGDTGGSDWVAYNTANDMLAYENVG